VRVVPASWLFTNIAILAYTKRSLTGPGEGDFRKRLRNTLWGTWIAASLALVAELSIAFGELVALPEDEKVNALHHSISNLGSWEFVPFVATLGAASWLLFRLKQRRSQ
jgi:hypothetical protein